MPQKRRPLETLHCSSHYHTGSCWIFSQMPHKTSFSRLLPHGSPESNTRRLLQMCQSGPQIRLLLSIATPVLQMQAKWSLQQCLRIPVASMPILWSTWPQCRRFKQMSSPPVTDPYQYPYVPVAAKPVFPHSHPDHHSFPSHPCPDGQIGGLHAATVVSSSTFLVVRN